MAKKSLVVKGGNGTEIQGTESAVTSVGQAVSQSYIGIIEDRQWLRGQDKDRIERTKEQEQLLGSTCKTCSREIYRPHIEDTLLEYYSEFNKILDSLSRFDSKHDIDRLLESVVTESARVAFDTFLKFVPQLDRERIILDYMANVKMKTEDLIRRSSV